jgi:ABC-type amino acid transport system permease subunit
MWIVGFILAIILLIARMSSDSEVLRIIGNLLIAILIGTGLPTVTMFAIDKLAASHQGCIREVQCFRGRNQELPYLATAGRWSHWREFYWYLFFGGIALAAVCLANKDIQVLKVFGVTLLTAVLLFYCTTTVLVNCEELPELQPLRSQFEHSMIRLCVYSLMLSIGVGMLSVYDLASNAGISGKVFFALGFGGSLAEVIPRVHQVWHGERAFTRTPDPYRLVLSYVLCWGVAVGSLLVGTSDSEGVRLGGKIVLGIAIVASLFSYCCFVRKRPLVRT